MTVGRKVELATGFIAGGLGLMTLVFILFGPLYSTSSTTLGGTTTHGSASLVEVGLSWRTVVYFTVVALAAITVAAGAYLHALREMGIALALVWVGAMILLAAVVVGIFSVGCFLLPTALLSLVTALTGSYRRRHHTAAGV